MNSLMYVILICVALALVLLITYNMSEFRFWWKHRKDGRKKIIPSVGKKAAV